MKERLLKFINKNLKMTIIMGIVIVMGLGMLLVLIYGNDEARNEVPVDPTAEEEAAPDRELVDSDDYPGVSDIALDLYNARVDDISDTAAIAQLVEASDMREVMGDYLVTLKLKNGKNKLIITFEDPVMAGSDAAFDEQATWYAEQFLALIPEAKEVGWKYELENPQADSEDEKDSDKDEESDEKSEEEETVEKFTTVEKSVTVEQADELLGTEVKGYGESPELVQTLLNNQKGII